jgi:hypothetical protein
MLERSKSETDVANMNAEQEREARQRLRTGITGENVPRPLDEFTVEIITDPLKIHDLMSEEENEP